MKTLLTLIAMGLSATLFALPRGGKYEGGGTWKHPSGDKGKWTETTTIEWKKDTAHIESTLKVFLKDKEVHSEQIVQDLVHTGNGFFDLLTEGKKFGDGYCFKNICHYNIRGTDESAEETAVFSDKGYKKMGSSLMKTEKGEENVAWIGFVRRVK